MKLKYRKRFKVISVLIILLILFMLFNTYRRYYRNTDKEKNKLNGQVYKSDISPITFDWYINYPEITTKWGNNFISKYVTNKTGVSLNFIIPSGDETENLNAMIDRGKLPDFITLNAWDDECTRFTKEKLVLSLDKLAKKYDTYFLKIANKQKLEWYKQNDGHVYCYPNFSLNVKDKDDYREDNPSNQTFLVRKDIYEAIGKPDMRTPEGFLNALEKAKEKYPTVEDKTMIPLGMDEFDDLGNLSLDSILPDFLAVPFEKEGKIYDRRTDPEYITWLRTLRKANELGLLSKDIFVDKKGQIKEKIADGRYFSLLYQRTDMVDEQLHLYKIDKNKIYIPVCGPANSKLDEPRLPSDSISGWTVTFISKDCKNPKRAIKFLSYLISEEGNKDLFLGKEGVLWKYINGKEQFKPEVINLLNNDRKAFYEKYGAEKTYWMLMDTDFINKWEPAKPKAIQILESWPKGKTYNFSVYDQINPYADTEEGAVYEKINYKWKNTLKNLLTSKSDNEFNQIFSDFLTYEKNEGYSKVQAYQQKKFEENKRKLNISK
ncbi:extracellular solute-binding protein [Clostridium felsineum]|uniref:Uncharacterized protein n=1 Tax=Clostridium felsineum TaxID=36839 RepID=A0A1S8LF81_9CLOT|nr:extracellular solute-binding protein [Clostridium felsineum]URZ07411.1 hypothetical protein CLROS_027490 [Clostridium felsineum]URZ12442.1 hypothetical protein CROST_031640 [Clostridium felsineum]